jgi:hypothetical protein
MTRRVANAERMPDREQLTLVVSAFNASMIGKRVMRLQTPRSDKDTPTPVPPITAPRPGTR